MVILIIGILVAAAIVAAISGAGNKAKKNKQIYKSAARHKYPKKK
jgi:hypothetical protein